MTTHRSSTSPSKPARLFAAWQAEAVRLLETQGPLEDQTACQIARRDAESLPARILARATWLARRQGLDRALHHWTLGARWALVLLALAALLAGVGTAVAALGEAGRSVNLARAWLALLGLHGVTFLLWLLSLWPGAAPPSLLARLWLWLSQRFSHKTDDVLAARALHGLLGRVRAWRPLLGLLSHGFWLVLFSSALATLLLLLSTRQYTFHWETTLLSPDAFDRLTRWLGTGAQWLGFPLPDRAATVAALTGTAMTPAAEADWSLWIIGSVVTWGLIPRALAFAACLLALGRALRRPLIDVTLPGWLALRERLMPTHQSLGTDHPPTARPDTGRLPAARHTAGRHAAILAHELSPDDPWPPAELPDWVTNLERGDSRADRARVRHYLAEYPDTRLLLVCDGRQSPDRGSRAWFAELAELAAQLTLLRYRRLPDDARDQDWQAMRVPLGISETDTLQAWLDTAHDPQAADHD